MPPSVILELCITVTYIISTILNGSVYDLLNHTQAQVTNMHIYVEVMYMTLIRVHKMHVECTPIVYHNYNCITT